jgi:lipopolysaccharide biosynthesis glycosyltransferase
VINLFVGLDPAEIVGFHVFVHSVLSRTDPNQVAIHAVCGQKGDASNRFNRARFEIPYRLGFKGWAIWLDGSDMLCRCDIRDLWELRDPSYDLMCVQHSYSTKFPTKFLGQPNEDYPKKQWSSAMLINAGNYPWRKLTPEYVAKAKPSHLHRFEFLKEDRIGDLPKEYNWLSLEQEFNPDAKIVHFTVGLPCWKPYSYLDPYSVDWKTEHQAMNYFEPWNSDDSVRVSER